MKDRFKRPAENDQVLLLNVLRYESARLHDDGQLLLEHLYVEPVEFKVATQALNQAMETARGFKRDSVYTSLRSLDSHTLGVVRWCLQRAQRRLSELYEEVQDKTQEEGTLALFADQARQARVLLTAIRREAEFQRPRLTDFLHLAVVEKILELDVEPEVVLNEKFHVLRSSSTFSRDLTFHRKRCELRGVPLAVAFLDIDDFKKFNSKLTEPTVDRDVLPPFLRAIEAAVYCRGFAYQEGGDEYLLILPNSTFEDAERVLKGVQEAVAGVEYPPVVAQSGVRLPTVSIGYCVLMPDSQYTNAEARKVSAIAKDEAKKAGEGGEKGKIHGWPLDKPWPVGSPE